MTNAGRRPVTAQDLTRLRGVSDPQISPDGRRVAFVIVAPSLRNYVPDGRPV